MPKGVYQHTNWHRERLRVKKKGRTGHHTMTGYCDLCGEKDKLYQADVEGMVPKKGRKYIWVCLKCAHLLHDQGRL